MANNLNLVETISFELGAQEPWPSDVKLFQPYAVEQILLPDNANCLAVQAFLHMCGLPFQIEHRANAEFMSPSGKVPFIKCGAFVISELEPIVQFVSNKGISLTADLDRDQKSDMRAYMSIIHTVLMNAELYICWVDKQTYNEVTKIRNGSVYPWPLNYFQTWMKCSSVIKWLKIHGWYRKSIREVYDEVDICCKALSERLEGKDYFFGDKPTELDALLYGHIFSILSNPLKTNDLMNIIIRYPIFIKHCKRVCTNFMTHTSILYTERSDKPFLYGLGMTKSKNTVNNSCQCFPPSEILVSDNELSALKTRSISVVSSTSSLNLIDNVDISEYELNNSLLAIECSTENNVKERGEEFKVEVQVADSQMRCSAVIVEDLPLENLEKNMDA